MIPPVRLDLELAPAGPARRSATRRGEIAYWELGKGEPVLCLHGFPDHPLGLISLATEIAAAGFRVICPALPGYWPSSPVKGGDYTIPAVAQDLLELMDDLGLQRVALVGHDWGACLGYHLGARHPERLTALVALATPHPAGFVARRTIFAEQRTAWYALLLAYAPGGAAAAADRSWLTALVNSWSPGLQWPQWPDVAELITQPGVPDAVCAYYRADLDADLEHEPVTVPATVIYGGQDGCIHPIAYAELDRWFERGLTAHFVPSVGHWPHVEDPDTVIPLIKSGLAS